MAKGPRAQGTDPVRPEHPQDHQDDGAGGHVEAQAGTGSGAGGPTVRRSASPGDCRSLCAGPG